MAVIWSNIFDNFGSKIVTKTDKAKAAYVPTAAQVAAISTAGIKPSLSRPATEFKITVLNDQIKSIGASFYLSERVTDASRSPEPRMGHAFISSPWPRVGDRILIGNIGSELFALRVRSDRITEDDLHTAVADRGSEKTVLDRALKAKGKPRRTTVTRDDFQRNPYVVVAALNRSNGRCEMPGCANALFLRDDNSPYLEVHHVIPLGEGGDDTLANAAALCPHCHRELHFGKEREIRRTLLARHISSL